MKEAKIFEIESIGYQELFKASLKNFYFSSQKTPKELFRYFKGIENKGSEFLISNSNKNPNAGINHIIWFGYNLSGKEIMKINNKEYSIPSNINELLISLKDQNIEIKWLDEVFNSTLFRKVDYKF